MSKSTGVTKWFKRLSSYGFINPDDEGQDEDVSQPKDENDRTGASPEGKRVKSKSADRKEPQTQNTIVSRE